MRTFSLQCFGVGDGWPSANRNHSSFLYRLGEVTLLIDCGEPVSARFNATGLDYDSVDRIFLSHLHSDHIGGFFMLMQGFWLEKRRKDLSICLPADGIAPIRGMLNAACLFDELFSFRLAFEPLKAAGPVMVRNARVTPYHTTHLNGFRRAFREIYPLAFESFCFLIEWEGLRIGHSADIGGPEDLAPLVAAPLDLLVCEMAHAHPENLFRYLKDKPIKQILFIHLTRRLWKELDKTQALAAQMLPGIPFSFAHDGEEVLLNRQ
ncbi:MAG: MBL fold metallo-hydrolase [Candidatus Omnitrophica bacterium]|nr:MBL fold metallo-hydrolase [Candidatus Omnitrophota bacterium]